MRPLFLFLILGASAQDEPGRLIERLGSDSLEDRDKAAQALRALGPAALDALRKARANPDAEIVARADSLIAFIEIEQAIPPRLRRAVPDLAQRLVSRQLDWCTAVVQLADREAFPWVRRGDLDALVPRALAVVADEESRRIVVLTLASFRLPSVAPHLLPYLEDQRPEMRNSAIQHLAALGARDAAPRIVGLLKDPDAQVAEAALQALLSMPGLSLQEIAPLLRDERRSTRMKALQALGGIGGAGAARLAVPLLKDPGLGIREMVGQMLTQWNDREVLPFQMDLLSDPVATTRLAAVRILARAEVRDAAPGILKLLGDPHLDVRYAAVDALAALSPAALQKELLVLLGDADPVRQADTLRILGRVRSSWARAEVARRLDAKDLVVRSAAIEAVAALRHWEAVPAALALLDDPEPVVRNSAVSALATLGVEAAVPKFVELLKDPACRRAVLQALPAMGARREAPHAAAFFDDPDEQTRVAARHALEQLDLPAYRERSVPGLLRLLDDPEERESALMELGRIGARSVSSRILSFLGDEREKMGWVAQDALIRLEAVDQIPGLVRLLKSPRPEVRGLAVETLTALGTPEVAADLRPLLQDPSYEVRTKIVDALAALEGAGAAQALEGLLGNPSMEVRCKAVHGLVQIKARDRAAKIVPLLQDPALEVRNAAAVALDQLDAREHAGDLVRLLRKPESDGHGKCPYAYAQDALRRWKSHEVVPFILELLKEPASYVRSTALNTLVQMEAPVPEATWVALLEDPEPTIRSMACHGLQKAGAKSAIPALRALLEDEEVRVRASAAGALQALADPGAAAELGKLLDHPDRQVRLGAAKALGKVPALIALLQDSDSWTQGCAAKDLAERGAREAIPAIAALLGGRARQEAAEALGRLRSHAHAPDLVRLLKDPEYSVKDAAVKALLQLDRAAAVAALEAAIERESGLVLLLEGNELVARLQPVAALARRLSDADGGIRVCAINLLGKCADPAARKAVAGAIGDVDPVIRAQVAELLSSGDDEEALKPLLLDPHSSVRIAAAKALCRRGRKEAGKVLLDEAGRWTGVDLTTLNALRQPKEWAVLIGRKVGPAQSGPTMEALEKLAEASGLKLEFRRPGARPGDALRHGEVWFPADVSIAEALGQVLARTSYVLVVEPGRLRLIPREEELAFWRSWAGRP